MTTAHDDRLGHVRVWRPGNGLEVVHMEDALAGYSMFCEQYAIALTPRDHAGARYRCWSFDVTDGAVQIVEPGELTVCTAQHRAWNARLLFVDARHVEQAAHELGLPGGTIHFARPVTWDSETYRTMDRFHDAVAGGAQPLEMETALAHALTLLVERHGERAPSLLAADKPLVARAREYLHAHWAERVTLGALATASFSSRFHLTRTFKQQLGVTPGEYQRLLRVAAARRMIAAGRALTDAAYTCGFADQAHLTRAFRHSLGVTPGWYQREVG